MDDLHHIADDLARHDWYHELVAETIASLERYLAAWAAFEDALNAVD
jgi:hypothetical protein